VAVDNRQVAAIQFKVWVVARMVWHNFQPNHILVEMSGGGYIFHPQTDNSNVNVHNVFAFLEKRKPARGGSGSLSANTWVRGAPKCLRQYIT
jgi:hypothetical protein